MNFFFNCPGTSALQISTKHVARITGINHHAQLNIVLIFTMAKIIN
jgi:hypothetical protein